VFFMVWMASVTLRPYVNRFINPGLRRLGSGPVASAKPARAISTISFTFAKMRSLSRGGFVITFSLLVFLPLAPDGTGTAAISFTRAD
jgi:hypothetical protein